jgi:hypothetical protein
MRANPAKVRRICDAQLDGIEYLFITSPYIYSGRERASFFKDLKF